MSKYRVTYYWTMANTIEIEAKDEAEAQELAKKLGEAMDTSGGSYVDDSFEVGTVEAEDDTT